MKPYSTLVANGGVLLHRRPLSLSFLSLPILIVCCAWSQAAQDQHKGTGGMASGGLHKPVYDSANRPITAGGTVKTGPIIFMDIAKKAGLTIWHHTAGPREALHFGCQRVGSRSVGLRQRWMARHLLVNGSTYKPRWQGDSAARGSLPQQPRRNIHRCGRARPG